MKMTWQFFLVSAAAALWGANAAAQEHKCSGTVADVDGKPATDAQVAVFPPMTSPVPWKKSGSNGAFSVTWAPQQYQMQSGGGAVLLARDVARNLAATADLDEDATNVDLKLAPALTLAGRVESGGKPVPNATAALIFWIGNSGRHIPDLTRGTNTPGQFEIPALPSGRKYGVMVSAPGFGQHAIYDVGASGEAGRIELDTVELKPANFKLAGEVLDADDNPVVGVNVNLNGDDQPPGNTTTDRKGQFHFDQVCEGMVRIFANGQNGQGNISAEGGDTNVVVRLGESVNMSVAAKPHKLTGTVADADGKPAAGAQVAVFPSFNSPVPWKKTGTNGAFNLTWQLEPYQVQSGGGALLVALDRARNLASTAELDEETTNLNVKLEPALTIAGQVRNVDDTPLAGAQVGVWIETGNSAETLNEKQAVSDAQGRYEIKCLPPEGKYIVFASAKGHGRVQKPFQGDPETNRVELSPFVLKLANQVLAGQVVNEDDKPVSGASVQLMGGEQPEGMMTTDSKGRFHFQVCEGRVQIYANAQNASGQTPAEAGDTNVVLTLRSQGGNVRQAPARAALTGKPLPDLAGVNFAADAAPAGRPVLLCLLDAGQRSSRHTVNQLVEQAAALRQQGITVLCVQAVVTTDETLNEWKSASPVSFPIGRVTEKSDKTKWAASVPALPWLILTDAGHRVAAEGFALDELDAQIKKVTK